jgi:hypothetical protein
MKTAIIISTILIHFSCYSQTTKEKYILDDVGIMVENFEKSNQDDDKYSKDNKIYTIGKKFYYTYYYENMKGDKFLIEKGEEIKKEGYSVFGWRFIEIAKQNAQTLKNIVLKPISGNPFEEQIPDYNQTGISYEYLMNNNLPLTMEVTGAIENEVNTWIHPPRSSFFQILELNPFPYIKAPYKVGTKWNWKLEIGDHWSDKRWLEWKGRIENNYDYQITEQTTVSTKVGDLECFVIKAKAKSRIGETELISYFNPDYGFIKLEYKNIDGTKIVLELDKME